MQESYPQGSETLRRSDLSRSMLRISQSSTTLQAPTQFTY